VCVCVRETKIDRARDRAVLACVCAREKKTHVRDKAALACVCVIEEERSCVRQGSTSVCVCVCKRADSYREKEYGVATTSRRLKIIGLFCRI